MSKYRKWIIALVVVAGVGFIGFRYWQDQKAGELPEGIASGNGRLEASSSTSPPRSRCGSRRSSSTRATSSSRARCWCAWTPSRSRRSWPRPRRAWPPQESSWPLPTPPSSSRRPRSSSPRSKSSGAQDARGERRLAARATTSARRRSRRPRPPSPRRSRCWRPQSSRSRSRRPTSRRSRPASTTRRSCRRSLGRVLYRLAEPGEVLGAGGKALTLVNLEDVYMEIFLPSEQAAALKIGAEGRITVDYAARPRGRRLRQLRVARGAVHAQAGRDEERAREADVPREDPAAEGAGRPVHRAASRPACAASATSRSTTRRSGRRGCRTRADGRQGVRAPGDPRGRARLAAGQVTPERSPCQHLPSRRPPVRRQAGRLRQGRHPPLRQGRGARRHLARHSRAASWSASSARTASASRR